MSETAKQLKEIANQLDHIADIMILQDTPPIPSQELLDYVYSADWVLKHATDEELFSLFHKFKEYYNKMLNLPKEFDFRKGWDFEFYPTDKQISMVITQLKRNYTQ